MLGEGKDVADVCRELQVSEQTYYRRRNQFQFGGLKADDAKRLKDLERENATLERLLADAELCCRAFLPTSWAARLSLDLDRTHLPPTVPTTARPDRVGDPRPRRYGGLTTPADESTQAGAAPHVSVRMRESRTKLSRRKTSGLRSDRYQV